MPEYMTLKEASGRLPMPVHACSLWRWCTKGFSVRRAKRTVKLQHIFLGRRLLTTQEWLDQFLAEMNPPSKPRQKRKPATVPYG